MSISFTFSPTTEGECEVCAVPKSPATWRCNEDGCLFCDKHKAICLEAVAEHNKIEAYLATRNPSEGSQ